GLLRAEPALLPEGVLRHHLPAAEGAGHHHARREAALTQMVRIPEGPFLRGSPPGMGMPEERPQREIWLDAFEIDRFPVTFGEVARFIDAGGYGERSLGSEEGWAFKEAQGLVRPRFWAEPEWAHVAG